MENQKKSPIKVVIKTIIIICICLAVVLAVYTLYVFVSYQRIDNYKDIFALKARTETPKGLMNIETEKQYSAISYNIGFSSYLQDFSYYADGGNGSWAKSADSVKENTSKIADFLNKQDADFVNLQEVDSDSNRSYNVDEVKQLLEEMPTYVNYRVAFQESPFIIMPLFPPTGIIKSNLTSYSKNAPERITRFQLPIDSGLGKFFDADRCYSKAKYKVSDSKNLIIYNTHISQNLDDTSLPNSQIEALIKDMNEEAKYGAYTICMGDFNKQLVNSPEKYFPINKIYQQRPFPSDFLTGTEIRLVAPFTEARPVGSYRESDKAYDDNSSVANVDGFLVSSNVEITSSSVIDTNFQYSNHNPVKITFKLKKK